MTGQELLNLTNNKFYLDFVIKSEFLKNNNYENLYEGIEFNIFKVLKSDNNKIVIYASESHINKIHNLKKNKNSHITSLIFTEELDKNITDIDFKVDYLELKIKYTTDNSKLSYNDWLQERVYYLQALLEET